MKPSAAKPNPPAASAATTPAAAGVTDELRAIDTTSLDRLLEIRKEESRLEEYLARAEEIRETVQEVVWRRVMSDYTARVAVFEEQATPLKVQVRAEYQKLRALLDRVRALRDEAEIEKAELEFRQAVGELSDTQLQDMLRQPTEALEQCRADLTVIEDQKERFLSAFGSEAALELPAAAPGAATGTATLPAGVPATEPDMTRIVSLDTLASMSEAAMAAEAAAPRAAARNMDGLERTVMVPAAGLLIRIDGSAPREYRLAAMTYLGRSDENQVQIARPGVSRQHALISAGGDGFSIKDLHSQNGTLVNGERITEQPLNDGDEIVVGDATIVFRTPWPVAASRT